MAIVMTEKMLEKWAATVADAFFSGDMTLNDGVTKVAQEEGLSPEQIKRLVEAVNTTTFLQKFNSMSTPRGQADRMVEFETADPNAVINRLLKSAKAELDSKCTECKVDDAGDLTMSLPVTRCDEEPLPPEKTASAPAEPRINRTTVINRFHKTVDLLKTSEYQARVNFTDTLQNLTDRFRRINGASFEAFEKDAFYQYGEEAVPHLQLIRQALRKPQADYDLQGMRKHARFVETRTPEMDHLRKMMHWTAQRKHAEAALAKVTHDLGRLNKHAADVMPLILAGTALPFAYDMAANTDNRYETILNDLREAPYRTPGDKVITASTKDSVEKQANVSAPIAGLAKAMLEGIGLKHVGMAAGLATAGALAGPTLEAWGETIKRTAAPGWWKNVMLQEGAAAASKAVSGDIGSATTGLFTDMVSKGLTSVGAIPQNMARNTLFAELQQQDDVLSQADPQALQEAYHTMVRFAPTLATDKNAVRSFLRESVLYGTGPNVVTIKQLADAEQTTNPPTYRK